MIQPMLISHALLQVREELSAYAARRPRCGTHGPKNPAIPTKEVMRENGEQLENEET